jgi:hypothetical protein
MLGYNASLKETSTDESENGWCPPHGCHIVASGNPASVDWRQKNAVTPPKN